MGKPVKIHKKKSFMFTTKHNSFLGWFGTGIAVFTLSVIITLVIYSYNQAGNVSASYGGVGLATVLLNLIGLICGIISIRERDVFKTTPIIAISGNGVMIVAWAVLLLISA